MTTRHNRSTTLQIRFSNPFLILLLCRLLIKSLNMKTSILYLVLSFVISIKAVNAQKENSINYLGSLPTGLTLDKSTKRSYQSICQELSNQTTDSWKIIILKSKIISKFAGHEKE